MISLEDPILNLLLFSVAVVGLAGFEMFIIGYIKRKRHRVFIELSKRLSSNIKYFGLFESPELSTYYMGYFIRIFSVKRDNFFRFFTKILESNINTYVRKISLDLPSEMIAVRFILHKEDLDKIEYVSVPSLTAIFAFDGIEGIEINGHGLKVLKEADMLILFDHKDKEQILFYYNVFREMRKTGVTGLIYREPYILIIFKSHITSEHIKNAVDTILLFLNSY